MKFKIYIPSKGRANRCFTAMYLKNNNIPFNIVVEPNDYDNYLEVYSKDELVVLDANSKGLSYARNFIKRFSLSRGEDYHWQLDDDISYLVKRIDGKNLKINPLEIFNEVEEKTLKYKNIKVSGLKDVVFAWTKKEARNVNKLIASAFLVENDLGINWSDNMIEDIDYCIQVLEKGYCTLIFNRLAYQKKPNNKDLGGQAGFNYERLNINLVNKYPNYFKLVEDKKTGLKKVAASRVWGKFKSYLIEKTL